uniref:Uncharacterized protein n=1 Tax=uncultured Armatimonadetes bacterium TaxID=157466 RepID=A0A6J4I0Y7_9BACT|nr:hypothetical protein AVDCRST_MAG63-1233 [uncultured Armatimonadetes bacterium]
MLNLWQKANPDTMTAYAFPPLSCPSSGLQA